jgi:hypothetical protein
MKKLNIGVSIQVEKNGNIWNSGHNQNIAFLLKLLSKSPICNRVYLLKHGVDQELPATMAFDGLDVPTVSPHEVTHEIDVVIEMGILLPDEWLKHVRALGSKIITFIVGNTLVGNIQSMIFDRPGSLTFNDPSLRHEIWTLPEYERIALPMLRTTMRIPVFAMPHIWDSFFIDKQTAQFTEAAFGFDPHCARLDSQGWRVGIFEPNIAVTKCCFIPMLVCEHAYRRDRASVSYMMVMNSMHMKEHQTFFRFASNLDLTKDKKATYEPRLVFSDCMASNKLDAVVSHHWENGQNYLYYDALHGGYPLIHNSEFLQKAGVGIYYPEFSAKKGGDALLEAWKQPPEYWQDYKQTAARYLQTLHPEHPENIRIFTERLMDAWANK